jgi:hypothetical protein
MNDVYESDSDDVDESMTVPKPPEEVSYSCSRCLSYRFII